MLILQHPSTVLPVLIAPYFLEEDSLLLLSISKTITATRTTITHIVIVIPPFLVKNNIGEISEYNNLRYGNHR